jgi:hypothetical protein
LGPTGRGPRRCPAGDREHPLGSDGPARAGAQRLRLSDGRTWCSPSGGARHRSLDHPGRPGLRSTDLPDGAARSDPSRDTARASTSPSTARSTRRSVSGPPCRWSYAPSASNRQRPHVSRNTAPGRRRRSAAAGSCPALGLGSFETSPCLFVVGAAAVLYLAVDIDLHTVGAVVLLIVRSLSYAQNANRAVQQMNEQSPNLDALLLGSSRWRHLPNRPATASSTRSPSIELRDVGYDYAPGRPGVDGVTLTISAGEALGVIGPSGGGKTTLAQVLLRLRPPTRGTVEVSGIPYQEIDPSCWHRLVAVVPQEPKLFQGTVAENISFFRSDIDAPAGRTGGRSGSRQRRHPPTPRRLRHGARAAGCWSVRRSEAAHCHRSSPRRRATAARARRTDERARRALRAAPAGHDQRDSQAVSPL